MLAAPTITREPGWTLIRCDDPGAFEDWLGRDETGIPEDDGNPALGSHLLIEMYGCSADLLDSVQNVGNAMRRAADESEATTVATSFHEFEPYGVSGAVIIQESHYTIHTWPEHEYAAVDLFYCGGTVKVHKAIDVLRAAFKPQKMQFLVVRRGLKSEVGS
jgi:S-adenosylmethionine decarboxylase proenzyme